MHVGERVFFFSTLLGLKDLSEVRRNCLISIESIETVSSFGRTRADPLWVPRLLDCRTFSPGFVEAIKFMPKTALMVSNSVLPSKLKELCHGTRQALKGCLAAVCAHFEELHF